MASTTVVINNKTANSVQMTTLRGILVQRSQITEPSRSEVGPQIDTDEITKNKLTSSPLCNQNFIHPVSQSPGPQIVQFKECQRLANRYNIQVLIKRCRKLIPTAWIHNLGSQSPWTKLCVVVSTVLLCQQSIAVLSPTWTYFEDKRVRAYAGLFMLYFRHSKFGVGKTIGSLKQATPFPENTYSITGFFSGYSSIAMPWQVVYNWMIMSRLLAVASLGVIFAVFAILIYHSFTAEGIHLRTNDDDEDDPKQLTWLMTKEFAVVIGLFITTFLSILSILFWHGASCEVCSWVQSVAVSSRFDVHGNTYFSRNMFDIQVAAKWRLANAIPNQVHKETVYIGHGAGELEDDESKAIGYSLGAAAEGLLPRKPEELEDTWVIDNGTVLHSAIHGTVTEELLLEREMQENGGSVRDASHAKTSCSASTSIVILLVNCFVDVIFLTLVLATIGGHFFSYRSYPLVPIETTQ